MVPERHRNFRSEISGKFSIGNFGKLPRPIPVTGNNIGIVYIHNLYYSAVNHSKKGNKNKKQNDFAF